ncbi:MAG: MMPL family transporter [Coriobacteriales bacterium]|jgi:predicted RND superfamily exporter protein|nr:MMPL family transporter [Coriobacteriales bacterium]
MDKVFYFISRHRKGIVVLYALIAVVCVFAYLGVGINYNMADYLPEEANSTIALKVMEEEMETSIPNANVMVPDVSLTEAQECKEKLLAVENVTEVMWLDDIVDLRVPMNLQDADTVEAYYKDGAALFSVTVESGTEKDTVAAIREAIGEKIKISGTAAEQAFSQELAVTETMRAIIVLVPLIILILIISTTSWIEPFLYLLTVGVAIIINLGTNIFQGEISFVTLAVAPILQLAISIDYAIFLSHRFNSIRETTDDITTAMREAMKKSFPAITASAAATLFGFVGLLFMEFKIGPDMGISLVKGILISFICVMTLMPALTLILHKAIDKTKHKRILSSFKNIGNGAMKIRVPVFILVLAIMVPCFLAQSHNNFTYGTGSVATSENDAGQIEAVFGKTNTLVLMVPRGDTAKEVLLCDELDKQNHVKAVVSYVTAVGAEIPSAYLDTEVVSNFYSENYTRILVNTDIEYEGEVSFDVVENIRNIAQSYYGDKTLMLGYSPNLYDMKEFIETDDKVVELVSILTIFAVLLITFRSWLLPILIILAIKASIWINMSIPYFQDNSLTYIGYIVMGTVQLAATVDYAILLTDYYLANRKTLPKIPAMKKTLGEMVQAILVSGLILSISGFCLVFMSSDALISQLGMLLGRGVLISLALIIVFLPMLLIVCDGFLRRTHKKYKFHTEAEAPEVTETAETAETTETAAVIEVTAVPAAAEVTGVPVATAVSAAAEEASD